MALKGPDATSQVLQYFDGTVEALAHSVGAAVTQRVEQVWQMTLAHRGHSDDRPQTAPHTPGMLLVEEVIGTQRLHLPPEPAKLLLDLPGSGRLQAVLSDRHEPTSLSG